MKSKIDGEIVLPSGEKVKYSMDSGKEVHLSGGERYYNHTGPWVSCLDLNGTSFGFFSVSFRFVNKEWVTKWGIDCGTLPIVNSAWGSRNFSAGSDQEKKNLNAFLSNLWRNFINLQMMFEADLEKQKREMEWQERKIKEYENRANAWKEKKKRKEIQVKKCQDKLDAYLKNNKIVTTPPQVVAPVASVSSSNP